MIYDGGFSGLYNWSLSVSGKISDWIILKSLIISCNTRRVKVWTEPLIAGFRLGSSEGRSHDRHGFVLGEIEQLGTYYIMYKKKKSIGFIVFPFYAQILVLPCKQIYTLYSLINYTVRNIFGGRNEGENEESNFSC